ncbi:PAS domain-containing protein [Methylobacterium sp. J-090]|uniref:PAS domain-containing protein n=1 Tax=Methylobacterium sp. J-090 TaxID=2836666 RepID=UPI001FB89496|nr:PAS domain-containing protein [Methylobacterium sp. J-090]MCJ2084051.1 PAS domain-containing protein [Methylobacterium sp. J-090]
MIFAIDPIGALSHISQEWTNLTGQTVAAALDQGWLACVHDQDRPVVRDVLSRAAERTSEFSVRFRLCSTDGSRRWIGAGGVPSFGPPDRTFLGYLGSMTELAPDPANALQTYGQIGRFVPPPTHPATTTSDHLESIADHLLIANAMIEDDGAKAALPGLRQALYEVGRALARKGRRGADPELNRSRCDEAPSPGTGKGVVPPRARGTARRRPLSLRRVAMARCHPSQGGDRTGRTDAKSSGIAWTQTNTPLSEDPRRVNQTETV